MSLFSSCVLVCGLFHRMEMRAHRLIQLIESIWWLWSIVWCYSALDIACGSSLMAGSNNCDQTVLDTFALQTSARISDAPLRRTSWAPPAMAADLTVEEEPHSPLDETPILFSRNFESSFVNLRHPIQTKSLIEGGVRKNYYRVGKKRRVPGIPNNVTLKSRLDRVQLLMLMREGSGNAYVWDNLHDMLDTWDYQDMVDFSGTTWTLATSDVPDILWPSWVATRPGEPTASAVEAPTASAAARRPLTNPIPSARVGGRDEAGRMASRTPVASAVPRLRKRRRTPSE